jgi:hypothetical protein
VVFVSATARRVEWLLLVKRIMSDRPAVFCKIITVCVQSTFNGKTVCFNVLHARKQQQKTIVNHYNTRHFIEESSQKMDT